MSKYIAVSACLLGMNAKYDGKNNYNPKIKELTKGMTIIPICPEIFGGLKAPRNPAEIVGDKVLMIDSKDVTIEFTLGAIRTLQFLEEVGVDTVILKNGSPSCGKYTYDGTFSHTKVDRMGVAAKLLKEKGFNLIYID